MSPSQPFILRPVATTLLMIAIMLSGMLAFKFLPVAALPEVDYPTIQVQTFYPGASPDVMTSSVTARDRPRHLPGYGEGVSGLAQQPALSDPGGPGHDLHCAGSVV